MNKGRPTTIVIFGASGDLTERKLIPALFNLFRKGRLPENFKIVGMAGTVFTTESYLERLYQKLQQHAGYTFTEDEWQRFSGYITYFTGRASEVEGAQSLADSLAVLENGVVNRLYYMATPPGVFPDIIQSLGQVGMLAEDEGWRRVVIEKPFGTNLSTALQLNKQVHEWLHENQIYRIDHYLGKETVQNIMVARFANTIFEPVWNRNYIDHIQITVAEQVGLENRAGYYDHVGVLRDMFQNHLLQLLTLVAMEPPISFNADALRNEKVKVLTALRPLSGLEVTRNTVRGQYKGYAEEPGVDPKSTTSTYGALRLLVDNWRWQGVPFYLRSGKFLTEKYSEIVIQFKTPPHIMFPMRPGDEIRPNMLVLYLQPNEGIHLRFEAKEPDTVADMRSVNMEFHYKDSFGPTAVPEAYERLLLDALQGDASLFTRTDEVELAWRFIDPIMRTWEDLGMAGMTTYEPGSWGPIEADQMLARDGRYWVRGCQLC
ncbi:MAG: glucose-6-phosphate dehydrogenase [Anaerolineae bacterium]|nr:glucose-6-phosphate dehydrogenase [Anaerolineae bacterium]